MFRLLFELNRRMPNGTYGGVRGIINLYSIDSICYTPVCVRSGVLFKIGVQRRKDALTGPSVSIRIGGIAHGGIGSRIV